MDKVKYCKNVTLPDKLSELIRVAIKDLEAAEKAENVLIDMNIWHYPDALEQKCVVCLAGSVMRNIIEDNQNAEPHHFPDPLRRKFNALNEIRDGYIESALGCLGKDLPEELPEYTEITEYEDSPEEFKKDMLRIADELEEHSL
jgi:hypothetical protein